MSTIAELLEDIEKEASDKEIEVETEVEVKDAEEDDEEKKEEKNKKNFEEKLEEKKEELVDEVYKEAKRKIAKELDKTAPSPQEMYEEAIKEKKASLGGIKGELFEKLAKKSFDDFNVREDKNFEEGGGKSVIQALGINPDEILNKREELQ